MHGIILPSMRFNLEYFLVALGLLAAKILIATTEEITCMSSNYANRWAASGLNRTFMFAVDYILGMLSLPPIV